jgi:lipoic acid synthetase
VAASPAPAVLRLRVLGRVPYTEAWELQRGLHRSARDPYVLLLEHPPVFTLGRHADPSHLLVDPAAVGAEAVASDRGGDVTYHGPGQLVVYPIVDVEPGPQAGPAHVARLEDLAIEVLADLGLVASRLPGYPGVWVDTDGEVPRKIAAVGVRVARGRTLHGLALNVDPDLGRFSQIVPCGIADKGVTSLRAEGCSASMAEVVDRVAEAVAARFAPGGRVDRQDVAWLGGPIVRRRRRAEPTLAAALAPSAAPGARAQLRLTQAGVDLAGAVPLRAQKPPWLRVHAQRGGRFQATSRTVHERRLVTVCEEAGCPNITECWSEGTATFMINGERCTRSCGFCLVDTRRPEPLDPEEPTRVADAVAALGLSHAVVTAVARDDLDDGGLGAFAATVAAIHRRCPATTVEVLVPDARGRFDAIDQLLAVRPDVVAHNLETVARLQRAVRPSADYARSLAVLAHARDAGLTTKSGLMVGLGETAEEVVAALVDLRSVGVDLVTIGQYLRPSASHLPVARWWTPEEIGQLGEEARRLGFLHVEASPLTRSSYHARRGAELAQAATAPT